MDEWPDIAAPLDVVNSEIVDEVSSLILRTLFSLKGLDCTSDVRPLVNRLGNARVFILGRSNCVKLWEESGISSKSSVATLLASGCGHRCNGTGESFGE